MNASSDKRLSTADLVERAERPDDRVAEDFDEPRASERMAQRPEERFEEQRQDQRIGDQMGDRMSESADEPSLREVESVRRDTGARIDERVGQAVPAGQPAADEAPVELFASDAATGFRSRWDAIQIGFVDDPRKAVQQADELVAQVMASLAETFANQRSDMERYVNGDESASTERMRIALRRYRSFFQRLLTL